MSDLKNHERILKFFGGLLSRGQLHHAYCLVGPENTDKKTLALQLTALLLNIAEDQILLSPNFLLIEQELNEKTGKTKRDIDIEQIKSLREFSLQRPFGSERKVVLIDEADKMNTHSSNALLKTLEEPRGQTVFFLLTDDESQLLPTIRSRAQTVHVLSTENQLLLPEQVSLFLNLFGENFSEKMKRVDHLFGDKTDHIAARENLVHILNGWEVLNRDYLFTVLGELDQRVHLIESVKQYPPEVFLHIEQKIRAAKKYLLQNIHPKLLVEQILLEIP
jgi:hypothetical protein